MGTLKHFILLVIFYPLNSIVKKMITKKSVDNKLKMSFGFPTFTSNRKFDATNSDEYSLRDIGRQLILLC